MKEENNQTNSTVIKKDIVLFLVIILVVGFVFILFLIAGVFIVRSKYPKIIDFVYQMADFPGIAFEVTEMLRDGKIKVSVEQKGLDSIQKNSLKNSKIIAFSIISAALFIGSAMIIAAKIPPFWHQISIIGLAGFFLSGIFAIAAVKKKK